MSDVGFSIIYVFLKNEKEKLARETAGNATDFDVVSGGHSRSGSEIKGLHGFIIDIKLFMPISK